MKNLEGDSISLSIPLNENYASVLRLATASIAARMDFTWDKVEDLKMAISEVFLLAYTGKNQKQINLDFTIFNDRLEILVKNTSVNSIDESIEKKYSFFIITGLMDKVDFRQTGNKEFEIFMVKNRW